MPHWRYQVDVSDVFHEEGLLFEVLRDTVVRRIRESDWYRVKGGPNTELDYVVEDLTLTCDPDEFNEAWNTIYDYANLDRAWIITRR